MMDMSMLFINPSLLGVYRHNFMRHFYPRYPPLHLATLSSSIEGSSILDLNTTSSPVKEIRRLLKTRSFDFVGITVSTPFAEDVKRIIRVVRENSQSKIILGGPHVTSLPRDSFSEFNPDIICEGESDETIKEVISGKPLERISGIWFKDRGRVSYTGKREFIENIDSLGFPEWDLVNVKKYFTFLSKKNPTGTIETSRGCPYNCIYCNKKTFGRVFRAKTPGRVIDEIGHTLNSGFREIHMVDDGFTINRERAIEICNRIIKNGLNFPWALTNGIRIDSVDEQVLSKMHYAGCHLISFGVETGSEEMLRVLDRRMKIEQIKKAFKMARDAGIETLIGFFMVGLPGEKEEDIEKTIELARHLDADVSKVTIIIPFPGTRLYDMYRKDKLLTEGIGWDCYRMHEPSKIYRHENMSWDEIEGKYYRFLRSFYTTPSHYSKRMDKILVSYIPRIVKNMMYGVKSAL